MARLAVIQFPGSNCEYETARAATKAGFDAQIVRWNFSSEALAKFDAYILPGGFSYQDRVRAGAISAKLPVVGVLAEAAHAGKPILGICNGCQILAEAGLIPDVSGEQEVSVALARNARDGKPLGFMCDWIFVKPQRPEKSLFMRYFSESDVLPIPINHGEGRFVLKPELKVEDHAAFVFCDANGIVSDAANPNGSYLNLAGLSNQRGNVLAMMPHPERSAFSKQIPISIDSSWTSQKFEDVDGPWMKLFVAMREAV